MNTETKIKDFAELLERQTIERLIDDNLGCEANIINAKVSVKPGKKYVKVDIGYSGRYMIDQDGQIWGIKAYGVINRLHCYGTLDTTEDYFWGEYKAIRRVKT